MNTRILTTALGLTRIALGWIFLWAFIDKLFGLGFSTAPENAWLAGGSPTTGFLSFATQGPFAELFQSLAGNAFVDWIFMIGLLGIGAALMLGIGVNIAALSGAAMMIFMYLAVIPGEHNPFVDDHIIYTLVLVALASARSGRWIGFGERWSQTTLVQRYPILE